MSGTTIIAKKNTSKLWFHTCYKIIMIQRHNCFKASNPSGDKLGVNLYFFVILYNFVCYWIIIKVQTCISTRRGTNVD